MNSQNQNIRLIPLSGAYDDGPYCFLLQIDDCSILLDCGWDDRFDMGFIDRIMAHSSSIDAVLISHSDRAHLGALPILIKRGLKCPVYATVPVCKLGKLVMYDWMNSHHNIEEFDVFNLDDIDRAWKGIVSVNYSQKVHLPGLNMTVKPYCAGHSMGGAVWRITKTGEEAIVYAVSFNHRKERHLNAIPSKEFQRAHVFIMDSVNALYNPPRRKLRDETFVKKLVDTLRNGGDVMIVTDTAGRVLETAHFLDHFWSSAAMANLSNYSLAMMSNVAASVIEHAKMHIDWMNDKVAKLFEETARNPFSFRHVHLVHTIADLDKLRSPKVVMCSQVDMDSGYAHELFPTFVGDSRNTIILTGRSRKGTLGSKLIKMTEDLAQGLPRERFLLFEVKKRIPLDGPELEEYRVRNRQLLEIENEKRLEKFRREQRVHEGSSSEESDDDDEIATAVDKYIRLNDARSRKRSRPGDSSMSQSLIPTVPGVSVKLLAETAIVGRQKRDDNDGSSDEGVEVDSEDEVRRAKTRRLLSGDDTNVLKPQWENAWDVFFRHHVLSQYGLGKDSSKKKRKVAAFPMFPVDEDRRKVNKTEYGERINVDMFQERQRNDMFVPAPMQRPELETGREDELERRRRKRVAGMHGEQLSDDEDEFDQEKVDEDWPTKCVCEKELLEMKCNVEFIDFEGRADGESLTHVLEQIKPRSLILVKGSEEDNKHIKDYCEQNKVVEADIYAPRVGETVSLGLNMQFLDTELTDDLCEQIKFTPLLEGGKMAWVDARMVKRRQVISKFPPELQEKYADGLKDDDLIADVCPRDLAPPHDSVFMNDVKLTTLRDEVTQRAAQATRFEERVTAELRQGRLVIGRAFAMRRIERGKFQLEGTLSERYFKWREFCVSKFAMA